MNPAITIFILAAIATLVMLTVVIRKGTENGGFWYYLQHDNVPRRFRKCKDCGGTGVQVCMWNAAAGTSKWIAPPVELRGWTDKDGKGGRLEADGVNSRKCMRCLGLGSTWIIPENPDVHLHIREVSPFQRQD